MRNPPLSEVLSGSISPPPPADSSPLLGRRSSAVSYRLPIGSGIVVYAEYHYSGFCAARPGDILEQCLLQISGNGTSVAIRRFCPGHALALTGSYEASPEFTYAGQWVHNPRDRSGIVAPSVTYTRSDHVSLLGTADIPVRSGAAGTGLSERIRHRAAVRPATTADLPLRVAQPLATRSRSNQGTR